MPPFTLTDVAFGRLHSQRLIGEAFPSAVEAVRWLGPVQSQDYAGAKWAIGQRTHEATDAEIDRLFDEGAILRTHVMRPTWHFVLPEDISWLLQLTAPRIRLRLAGRYRELEIDEHVISRAQAAFAEALAGGRCLTRGELGEALRGAGVSPEGQRLPHLLLNAELAGLLVSGPRRGKQFTYALLADRAPRAAPLDPAEALAELTRRYFQSHGPAQVKDFVWWSGLTLADARTGLARAAAALEHCVLDGGDYWFAAQGGPAPALPTVAHLLPNFDEYTVAYRDRTAVIDPDRPFDPAVLSFGSVLSNVLTIGGRVRGAWRRTASRNAARVEVRLVDGLEPTEDAAVEQAVRRLGQFLQRPVELAWR